MTEAPTAPGDVLADAYRIDELVGKGSMGSVFAATALESGERVAIKVLHPRHVRQSQYLDRFVREARVAARLRSQHAVRVFDVGMLDQGVPFFVMEYLHGVDLQRHLKQIGPLSVARAADYLLQACEAVAEAHDLGVIHRDLKPANLFLARASDGQDRIKVIDFGVSKLLKPLDGEGDATATAVVLGTPAFMAPEQMRSSAQVDARTDVWALGVTLFWLVTGERPFRGDTIVKIYESILRGPPSMRELRPDVPDELEELVAQTLVWNPDERLQSVRELAWKLMPLSSGQLVPASAPAAVEDPMQATEVLPPEMLDRLADADPAASSRSTRGEPEPASVPASQPWLRRQAGRLLAGAAVLALAATSYALGAQQSAIRAPATVFAPTLLSVVDEAADLEAAAPRASEEAPADVPIPSANPSASETPASAARAPVRATRPRPKRPDLAPPKQPGKGDAVWGMP